MYQRFKNSISSPKMVFFYIKDSFLRVFGYILLLSLLLTIPFFIIAATNKDLLFPDSGTIKNGFETNFVSDEISVVEGKLIKPDNYSSSFNVDNYSFVIGVVPSGSGSFVIRFEEKQVVLYTNAQGQVMVPIFGLDYVEDFKFTTENVNLMYSHVNSLVNENGYLLAVTLSTFYVTAIFQILIFALIMSFIASAFKKLPLRFSGHFKVAIYLLTPWVIFVTIINLFGLQFLSMFGLLIIYVYHYLAYKSVKIVTNVKVDK